jgi:hypothetical protein
MHKKYLALFILALGIISLAIGGTFIGLSIQKNNYLVNALRTQKVTLGLTKDQVAAGKVVDNAQAALMAAETLNEHLSSIAPTYGDLMASNQTGRFDPSDPRELTYGQGLNLENSLNLAVLSFGVIQQTMATGAALAALGLAIGATGFILFRSSKKEA